MTLAKTNFEIAEDKLVVGIEFYSNDGTTMLSEYKFTFVKEVIAVDTLSVLLEKIDFSTLEWPKHCDYINGLAANFNELSESDKEKVSAELKSRLEQAVDILSADCVPAKLEVTTMPDKLYYGPNEAFNY